MVDQHRRLGPGYAPRLPALTAAAEAEVAARIARQPSTYVIWSGGKDSTVCLHLARKFNPDVAVVHYDSGIEFKQTRAYIEYLTNLWGLNLHTYHADPPALEVLAASGQWEHGVPKLPKDELHEACILRPAAQAEAAHGPSSIYGLRADESSSRLALLSRTRGNVQRHNPRTGELTHEHLAPIWRWSCEEVHAYCAQHQIPMNPLYELLRLRGVPQKRRRVGLVVDGWGLEQGRWAHVAAVDPDLAHRMEVPLPILAEWR